MMATGCLLRPRSIAPPPQLLMPQQNLPVNSRPSSRHDTVLLHRLHPLSPPCTGSSATGTQRH